MTINLSNRLYCFLLFLQEKMVRLINNNNDKNNKTKEGERERKEWKWFLFLATIATEDNEIRHEKQSICTEEERPHKTDDDQHKGKKNFFFQSPFFPMNK
jgi:hypothetical protein